jgi:hypothetical protein
MTTLELLKSDLRDSSDPRVLAKYPHLGDPKYVAELKAKIAAAEQSNQTGRSPR